MGLGREVLLHGAGVVVAVQHQVHRSSLHDLHLRIQTLLHYFSEVALDLLSVHPLVFVWACENLIRRRLFTLNENILFLILVLHFET